MAQSPLFNHAKRQANLIGRRSIKVVKVRPVSQILRASIAEDSYLSNEKVYIVGGGPSLKCFNFNALYNRCTITVNKSIFSVPNPNYFISVDYTFLRKVRASNFDGISAKKFFVADFSHLFLKEIKGQIVDTRFNLVYDLRRYNRLIKASKATGIGYTFEDFRTGRNSGFCALQLAVILGFKKIYLLGIDLDSQEDSHYHKGYGEKKNSFQTKLDLYFKHFEEGLKQLKQEKSNIQVISCSPTSRLNSIIEYRQLKEVFNES